MLSGVAARDYCRDMPSPDAPWEPPLAGSEAEHLLGALDRLRTTFRWKADDLTADALRVTVGASVLSIGSLLKHLAFVEAYTSRSKLAGQSPGPPWDQVDWEAHPGWDFTSAADDAPEALYAAYDDAVTAARVTYQDALARGGLDQLVHIADEEGQNASLRRLLLDLVEEYGRHTGHADLIREAIDGRVGEDPPPGWRPESGHHRMP
jgi:hypothetical protein